jgi:hypothetical protein
MLVLVLGSLASYYFLRFEWRIELCENDKNIKPLLRKYTCNFSQIRHILLRYFLTSFTLADKELDTTTVARKAAPSPHRTPFATLLTRLRTYRPVIAPEISNDQVL